MKILVISQQYWPGNWRIVDICQKLVTRGYQVSVVCGGSSKHNSVQKLVQHPDQHCGVTIYRVKDLPKKNSNLSLLRSYLSFSLQASKLVRRLPDDFDLVFVNQLTPIHQIKPGIDYSQKNHKKLMVYCLDVWPASLEARGLQKRGIFGSVFHHYVQLSSKYYNSADRLFISSPGFAGYLESTCRVPASKIVLLPQYADNVFTVSPVAKSTSTKKNFVFSGNTGKAQDVETILNAAHSLLNEKDIQITIAGDGPDFLKIQKMVSGLNLTNVTLCGRLPLEDMPSLYSQATCFLITLCPKEFASLVIPGKTQSYLAYGKPVIGAANGSLNKLINEDAQCGFCVASGDAVGLSKAILRFAKMSSDELRIFGDRGHRYYQENFSEETFFHILDKEFH